MKRGTGCFFLLLAIPALLGMGSLQGPATPEKIPIPVKKYFAVYVDQTDVITECSEASIDGATFLEGKRGEGTYTISFDNIDQVSFRVNAEQLIGLVKLRDGGTSELNLNKTQKAYGRTKYGTYQIKMADLKKLEIRNAAQK
ncbi:MAG: hypothetical protein KKH02_00960 [Proteobacteria bacterium]|nr:hypothetical protein [Pseudomonadota bacterium]MBU4580987.1 hypothetical protein [Pseudomonadota bacterium]MCG2740613.1 hypothetical protein [Syntrophaceae bacterium]